MIKYQNNGAGGTRSPLQYSTASNTSSPASSKMADWSNHKLLNHLINLLNKFFYLIIPSKKTSKFQNGHQAHWALEPKEVTLKSKFGKFENWLKVIMFDVKQHSG